MKKKIALLNLIAAGFLFFTSCCDTSPTGEYEDCMNKCNEMRPLDDDAYIECTKDITAHLNTKLNICYQQYYPGRMDEFMECQSVAIAEHLNTLLQCYYEFDSRLSRCRQGCLVNKL